MQTCSILAGTVNVTASLWCSPDSQPNIQTLGCLWPWHSQGISRQASAAHIHQLDSKVHDGRIAKSKHSIKKRKTVFHLKNVFKQKKLTDYTLFLCLHNCVKKPIRTTLH